MRILIGIPFFRHLAVSWSLPVARIISLKRCYAFIVYGTLKLYFHFFIYTQPGFEKNSVVFFSFVVRFRLVILFYSYFSICWLDFFPNIRLSNRSDFILRIKLSLSPRVI